MNANIFRFLLFFCVSLVEGYSVSLQSRIVNGHFTLSHQPHHVLIQYLNEDNAGLSGGGSLISSSHILTAGQIIFDFVRWKVGVGSKKVSQLHYIESTEAYYHPDFDSKTLKHDIGIIVLPKSIVFSADVYPIPLPQIASFKTPLANEEGLILGFGEIDPTGTSASSLLQGFQRVISDARCQKLYRTSSLYQFCGENVIDRSNVCSGDIGGGFIIYFERREILVGVASKVYRFCDAKEPSGYTRVSQYREWIRDVAEI